MLVRTILASRCCSLLDGRRLQLYRPMTFDDESASSPPVLPAARGQENSLIDEGAVESTRVRKREDTATGNEQGPAAQKMRNDDVE